MSYFDWINEQRNREKADFFSNRQPQQLQGVVVVEASSDRYHVAEAITDEEVADFTANWLSLQLTMQRTQS